ncbi:sensor histidine kinase [Actinomadura livida]|uniref:Oxygen sensor histidine kinase NreB n=1 Tax=Actinomadura livida TaxID=79909 RepID=A0A7W7IFD4_9ACTN|nr:MULTISPECIES: ATP-binding protein [Actinomadura]MBB4776057.1 signal transduction histidine kinase [Actinomadura catellatispora]GGU15798.1 two-component sensor histidine kinase [Actinomadura livida]
MAERPSSWPGHTGPAAASRLEADRAEIVAAYERVLDELGGPVAADRVARGQLVANAERVLTDVIGSLRAGAVQVAEGSEPRVPEPRVPEPRMPETAAMRAAAPGPRPQESVRTGAVFFDVVQRELVRRLDPEGESLPLLMLASRALYQSITCSGGLLAHEGYLRDMLRQAQVEERCRIGRELHDRVGMWLSAAYRQLELYDLDKNSKGPCPETEKRLTAAYGAVQEAMRILRDITSDLRFCESSNCLEKALRTAFEALATDDAVVQLKVNGDEMWASPAVKDESFLVVREAVRNALVHGMAELVLVRVDIAPHEMRIYVDDNGVGFDPDQATGSDGVGLSTMRERAELIGGTITVSSTPGQGARVELSIPLPGSENDAA